MKERVNLLNGDCLELMKSIPDKSVDLILCDFPYETTACKWDVIIPFDKLWEQYERIIKDKGAIVLFSAEPFSSKLRLSKLEIFKYDWIWEKSNSTGFVNAKKQPLRNYETISVFYKKQTTYNPQGLVTLAKPKRVNKTNAGFMGKNGFRDDYFQTQTNYPKQILKFKSEGHPVHPTQKPVELLEYLVNTYTKENEIVLDNTMGSGSTGVACVNTNRKFIGIEKDPTYFEIAKQRILFPKT